MHNLYMSVAAAKYVSKMDFSVKKRKIGYYNCISCSILLRVQWNVKKAKFNGKCCIDYFEEKSWFEKKKNAKIEKKSIFLRNNQKNQVEGGWNGNQHLR